ncbi:uncharacterized protein LOC126377617 [Pectinophora gossypiella]|uniref:uncharacterized protein LOC126377617 n=1 Tax=Pectinophora gossypiella TaxID=13191 RepID=UPI00214EB8F6|nr:uncharacterized protein LOC126377617 [Pectinophora gossypiella]
MWSFIFLVVVSILSVECNDIRLGYTTGSSRRIFNEIREANPALWTRTDDVIVNAVGSEVITAVYVTDLRDGKDGQAYIESGGIGTKSVTIGLRSPSVLRGYRFEIEVFADDPNQSKNARLYSKGGSQPYFDDGQYARKY